MILYLIVSELSRWFLIHVECLKSAHSHLLLLSVLYFMSPDYHDIIIDIVCSELNIVVEKYKSLTGFNGNISLLSHSLGT